jgi:hypothetical protein
LGIMMGGGMVGRRQFVRLPVRPSIFRAIAGFLNS